MPRYFIVCLLFVFCAACGGGRSNPTSIVAPTEEAPASTAMPTLSVAVSTEIPPAVVASAQVTPTTAVAPTTVVVPTTAPTVAPTVPVVPTPEPAGTQAVVVTATPAEVATPSGPVELPTAPADLITDAEPIQLRYGYAKGQRVTLDYTVDATITPRDRSQKAATFSLDALLRANVQAVSNGDATIGVTYDEFTGEVDDEPILQPGSQDVLDQLAYTVVVDELGNKISSKFANPGLQDAGTYPNQDAASLLGPILATKSVAPGDKWTSSQRTSAADPNSPTTRIDYTLEGYVERDGTRLARIVATSKIPKATTEGGATAQGVSTFVFLFDPEAGRTVTLDGTADLQIQTAVGQDARALYRFSIEYR